LINYVAFLFRVLYYQNKNLGGKNYDNRK